MSFSDPVRIIDHIPQDFDMKRITRKRPLEQRRAGLLDRAQDVERVLLDPRFADHGRAHRRGVGRQHAPGAIHDQRLGLAGALVDPKDIVVHCPSKEL